MLHRSALRAALVGAALTLIQGPLAAETLARFERTANGGVYTLSEEQAEALGAPGADRIGFIDLLAASGADGRFVTAGDVFDARAVLASTDDDRALRAILNGEAGRADLIYSGFPFDPLGETRLQARRDIPRAIAFAFRDRDGPVVFSGATSSRFDGAQTLGPFEGVKVGGGRGESIAEAFALDIPVPAAAMLLVLAAVGLYLSRFRFV
ncbi:MAG: hypothetical protein AAGI51_10995 [Pseudomonadota bacterium]